MIELKPIKLTYCSANKINLALFFNVIVFFMAICGYILFRIGLIADVPDRINMLNQNLASLTKNAASIKNQ